MLRAGIVSSVVLFSSAGLAEAAPDETILVGPGTVMFWASTYGSSVDRYSETLLANGDGFELFKTDDDYGSGEPSDYYALFSGILYVGCDEAMPSAEERAEIQALYPLTPGKTVEVGGGVPAKIAIEAPSEMFLMGQIWPAHTVKIEYQDEDASLETLKVLDQVPLTTQIDWDDDSKDTLLLVTKPKPQSGPALDPDLIGNCASLLNE